MIKNIIIIPGVLSDPMIAVADRCLLEVSKDVKLPKSVKRSKGNLISVSSEELRQIMELNPNETLT